MAVLRHGSNEGHYFCEERLVGPRKTCG